MSIEAGAAPVHGKLLSAYYAVSEIPAKDVAGRNQQMLHDHVLCYQCHLPALRVRVYTPSWELL